MNQKNKIVEVYGLWFADLVAIVISFTPIDFSESLRPRLAIPMSQVPLIAFVTPVVLSEV